MKKILILILLCLINTNSFADKKFEKDLKKIYSWWISWFSFNKMLC